MTLSEKKKIYEKCMLFRKGTFFFFCTVHLPEEYAIY